MGGLSRKIPITYVTMLVGSLAIAGIPPLAGFFSKDEILGESFKNGFLWVWAIGFLVAGLTAFYMFRLMGLTFWGAFRGPKAVWDKIHESPPVMTVPLILLAIPSLLLGMALGLPFGANTIAAWLKPVFEGGQAVAPRRRRGSGVQPVRHRRDADPRQRHRRGRRHRHRLAAVRGRAPGPPPGCPPGARPGAERPGPVPLPRLAQQVVVRRPVPPAVHRDRRPRSPPRSGGSTARSSTGPSTRSAAARSRPAGAFAASRPDASRTTRSGSPSG